LSISAVSAQQGTVSLNATKTKILYTPKANFVGVDLVTYTVRSSNGGTANGTMTMTVTSVNDAPVAVADTFTIPSSTNQSLNVLANDSSVDTGETLVITAITQPASGKGSVAIASDGKSLLYSAPSTTFTGEVAFTYTISDGNGLTATANVTLNVVNYTPRDVGVTTQTSVQGVQVQVLQLDGVGVAGSPVSHVPEYQGSVVKVADVGPGTYQFSVPNLPFFTAAERSVEVVSGGEGSDTVSTVLPVGTRDPNFMDVRDFTTSALRKGLTLAVQPNQQALWYDGVRDWRNYSNIEVTLNQAATQLTIQAVNPSNTRVSTTLAVTDPKVVLRAKEGANHMFRIQAAPSELDFKPVTSTGGASGEGSDASIGRYATPVDEIARAMGVDRAMQELTDTF
jgi:hypothetical protein